MFSDIDRIKIEFEQLILLFPTILSCQDERIRVENKLRRHFNRTSTVYLCSKEFSYSLNRIYQIVKNADRSSKYFTALTMFNDEMKRNSIFRKNQSDPTDTNVDENLLDDVKKTIDEILSKIDDKIENKKRIEKLERKLQRLSKTIRKLEESEMSLNEMADCDLYSVESNLKEKAVRIFNKLCKLKNESNSTQRILHENIKVPAIENCPSTIKTELENQINQMKYFPSFDDILSLIENVNKKNNLNLSKEFENQLAEKALKVIGQKLKQRRMNDFQDIMKSRLPEDFDVDQNDPAIDNEIMENSIKSNREEALRKCEEFTKKFLQFSQSDDQSKQSEFLTTNFLERASSPTLKRQNQSDSPKKKSPKIFFSSEFFNENFQDVKTIDQKRRQSKKVKLDENDVIILD